MLLFTTAQKGIVEVAKALGGSFKLVMPAPKPVNDSTAQGNTKGWGHTNKLKQYKHTKYEPRLNIKTHSAQPGCITGRSSCAHGKLPMYIVQPKCQGPLQLLSPHFLMSSTTKHVAKRKGGRLAQYAFILLQ